jgi:cell wall-associated NlpC family hydrolase
MFELTEFQKQQIKAEALANPKHEVCGLILNTGAIMSCQNVHEDARNHFKVATSQYIKYEPLVMGIYHSHVNDVPNFTANDVNLVYSLDKPLVLYTTTRNEFKVASLDRDRPLIDREFVYGINDCYSIVRDWYWQEFKIELGNYPRSGDTAKWDESGFDLIDRSFENEGFRVVNDEVRNGDLLAMSMGDINRNINHLGVYIGDDLFIHQLNKCKSRLETWGSPWRDYTIKILRHQLV